MSAPLILLVDDDFDFRELIRLLLEANGYRTAACASPEEAAVLIAAQPPDLILTDLMMQTLDAGFAFIRRLRQDPRTSAIPVILVTAIGAQRHLDFSPRSAEDRAALGVQAFFDKPVEPGALLAAVRDLLERNAGGPRR